MKRIAALLSLLSLLLMAVQSCDNGPREVKLYIVGTGDVHGSYYPYDFIKNNKRIGSLARVSSFLRKQRAELGDEQVIYVDNGDILQGQPTVYYYNYVNIKEKHLAAEMLNELGCDVATIGNHDVETGHAVYDRWIKDCDFPVICANMVDEETGKPYLKPYTVVKRNGVKVAFLGMTTPALPRWLPRDLWKGVRFEDIELSASRWIKTIQEKEKPQLIIGIFHSGYEGGVVTPEYCENAVLSTARNVPGFDAILYGHDHRKRTELIINQSGDTVVLANPGANALSVSTLQFDLVMDGKVMKSKKVRMRNMSMTVQQPDSLFMTKFERQRGLVASYVSSRVGTINSDMVTRDAYFGPSAFVDLIHWIQLHNTGADLSFASPLTYNTVIKAGDVRVRDMFSLYAFENRLCTVRMTGKEIKDYLEMSYGLWVRTMSQKNEHMMWMNPANKAGRATFVNAFYNFDSAAGILYQVDVTKPVGERITITGFANGNSFEMSKQYTVAMNSYRAMGGGDLLTKGAGISDAELPNRLFSTSTEDMRQIVTAYIKENKSISPVPLNHWRFVPVGWTVLSQQIDRKMLFGTTN